MTERLYYQDSFRREFHAHVLSCQAAGERWAVALDRTAFYPTSGGQPHDTGKLGDARVLEVVDSDAGEILHFTDARLSLGQVHGVIDWARRFDHMQQHTGQHILSAAFLERFKFPTVSFHMGRESSTIDLAASALTQAQMEEAERRANQIVFEDRPVEVSFATPAQLAEIGVRKQVEREGALRVIHIEGFDRQPCGGTHVARTSQIGAILLRKFERQKGNWRVEFVCGGRAVRAAREDYTRLSEAARALSCALSDVPTGVEKVLEERQAAHRARQRLLEQVAQYEAVELLAAADPAESPGAPRFIARVFEEAEPSYLRLLASKLAGHPDVQVLIATREGGHVVFAKSAGLPADMNALMREILPEAQGRGGGTRDFAQGSVPDPATLESVLARALGRVRSA
jgi:alanyl-tRNA synthetase